MQGHRDCVKAARTALLPGQHPLPDSAGGCWKEVKLVGNKSEGSWKSLEGGWDWDGGWAMCDSAAPTPGSVLGTGTGLGSSATPQWEWEAGS